MLCMSKMLKIDQIHLKCYVCQRRRRCIQMCTNYNVDSNTKFELHRTNKVFELEQTSKNIYNIELQANY